ncbi:MAG: hypothetical protein HGA84_05355, partial [Syntrophobacteraceae bacterium]|nr:hypothetical protein [Syntrophobacteraceae bacterium]
MAESMVLGVDLGGTRKGYAESLFHVDAPRRIVHQRYIDAEDGRGFVLARVALGFANL